MSGHPSVAVPKAVADAVVALMDLTVGYPTLGERLAAARILGDELLLHGIGTAIATGQTEDDVLGMVRGMYAEHRKNPLLVLLRRTK